MADLILRSPRRVWVARGIAIFADLLQLGLLPLFVEGALSPFDAVLDLVVAAILTSLVGWHWAFLPSFLAEITPGLDLVPSWTIAVFLATRGYGARETPSSGRVIDVERIPDPPDATATDVSKPHR